jgi:hypothetical protein
MEAIIDPVVIIGAFYRNDQWHTKASLTVQEIPDEIVSSDLRYQNLRIRPFNCVLLLSCFAIFLIVTRIE